MLNVGKLNNGFVLDHIKAGKSMSIYRYLGLDRLDCQVAIIKNAVSKKMGRKDIIKIEAPLDIINLDVLGYIDDSITVNIIEGGEITEKRALMLPKEIRNVVRCRNPRCITSEERELEQVFVLADREKKIYRCKYCDEQYGHLMP
ncbi:MAG: aspartate carbamoyltransferase regulatory subunit [Lachnospiraceae bacterium]|nr:aspartate carbamoyltransferase regulatory subunit [Lachnospiraceae bacterium]